MWRTRRRGIRLVSLAVIDLELSHQILQLHRHLGQFVRRFLRFLRAVPGTPRRFSHARNAVRDLSGTFRCVSHIARHLVGGCTLLFYRRRNRAGNVVHVFDHFSDAGYGLDRAFGVSLNSRDLAADVFRGLGRLLGQFLHFIGDNGETLARFSGTGRFYRGIESQQVGLLSDGSNDLDDFSDFGAGLPKFADGGVRGLRGLYGIASHSGRFMRAGRNALNGDGHFVGTARAALQVLILFLRGMRNHASLGGRLFGSGGDLPARGGKSLAGGGYTLRRVGNSLDDFMQGIFHRIQRHASPADFILAGDLHVLDAQVLGCDFLNHGQHFGRG